MKKYKKFGVILLLLLSQYFLIPLQSFCDAEENYKFTLIKSGKDIPDDLNYSGLKQAVERSISYFRKQPPDSGILFNGRSYSYSRLISSYSLFIDIVEKYKNKNLSKMLAKNFNLYTLSGEEPVLFTAYYEITIAGSSKKTAYYNTAVYSRPSDLVSADLNFFLGINKTITGKIIDNMLIPYDTREDIVSEKSLHDRAEVICYVNKIELFFLQTEGSGSVVLRDAQILHLTADISNGHGFVSIDKYLAPEVPRNSAGLKKFFFDHPEEAEKIMNRNPRYVFFKTTNTGSEGNIGELLTAGRSLAADNSVYPKGLIAYVKTLSDNPIMRFAAIQDTGSAIVGPGRFDLFFGSDEDEIKKAENFKQPGEIYIILPVKNK